MISFYHPNVNNGNPLKTRLSPTRIDWIYNLNTQTINTYGGQVVQILGINYDTLTIEGLFGKEGPHGKTLHGGEPTDFWDYKKPARFGIGLTQLTAFFQDYFEVAAQGLNAGGSTRLSGNYNQIPMIVSYTGYIDPKEGNSSSLADVGTITGIWSVYPTDFPSYSRAIEQFAPQFQIVFEVEEADTHADTISTLEALSNIQDGIGFDANSIALSYPGQPATNASQGFTISEPDNIDSLFGQYVPALNLNNVNNAYLSQDASTSVTSSPAYNAGYNLISSIGSFFS